MKDKYNAFLNNQCIETIVELSIKYPNDEEFGCQVRAFINDTKCLKVKKKEYDFKHLNDSEDSDY